MLTNGNKGIIPLKVAESLTLKENPEAYTLSVEKDLIKINANTNAGAFYGMQTLMQLLPAEIESPKKVLIQEWNIPSVLISDAPIFEYRGIMLDVCRHFRSVDFIKKQLDVMVCLD